MVDILLSILVGVLVIVEVLRLWDWFSSRRRVVPVATDVTIRPVVALAAEAVAREPMPVAPVPVLPVADAHDPLTAKARRHAAHLHRRDAIVATQTPEGPPA